MKLWLKIAAVALMAVSPAVAAPNQQNHQYQIDCYLGKVTLSWNASTSTDVVKYNLYRSTIQGGYYTLIGSSTTLTYVDSVPVVGVLYYYVATTVDSSGQESGFSNEITTSFI